MKTSISGMFRTSLLCGAMAVIVPASAHAQQQPAAQAPAQDDADANADSADQDIVVTARRTEEPLQRTPVTVTAISSETLARSNAYDSFTLLRQLPGVQMFQKIPGNPSGIALMRIRGVPGVANYFANAPYPAVQMTLYAPFFDVANVQVLKGPQGTLFGVASNAGAQLIEPNKPGANFGGYVKAEGGNYSYHNLEGALDIPVIADKVLLRVSAKDFFREGYIEEPRSGFKVGREKYRIFRGSMTLKPFDGVENYTVYTDELVTDVGSATESAYDFNAFAPQNAQFAAINGLSLAEYVAARDKLVAQQIALGPYKMQGWSIGCPSNGSSPATVSTVPGLQAGARVNGVFDINLVQSQACPPTGGVYHSRSLINTTTIELGDNLTLKNTVSRMWGRFRLQTVDHDSTRLIGNEANPRVVEGEMRYLPDTWSEELQLQGKMFDDKLNFVVGAFGYNEHQNPGGQPDFARFQTSGNVTTATRTETMFKSRALFGQVDIAVTDDITLTGGIRRNWDSAWRSQWLVNPTTFDFVNYITLSGSPTTARIGGDFAATNYTLGARWQATPDTMVYLTNTKGSSAGGVQNVPGQEVFKPDSLNNLELGVKTSARWGDVRLRANVAAYYGWFNNVKVQSVVLAQIGASTQFTVATQNVAAARIKGAEAEVTASFGDLLDVRAFSSLSLGHYTDNTVNVRYNGVLYSNVDRTSDPLLNMPKWKIGISPTFHVPVDRASVGDISLSANFTWQSESWQSINNPVIPLVPGDINSQSVCKLRRTVANGYNLSADGNWAYKNCAPANKNLNITLGWNDIMGHDGLSATLTVTNVTKETTPLGIAAIYNAFGFSQQVAPMPRMVFGTLKYAF